MFDGQVDLGPANRLRRGAVEVEEHALGFVLGVLVFFGGAAFRGRGCVVVVVVVVG